MVGKFIVKCPCTSLDLIYGWMDPTLILYGLSVSQFSWTRYPHLLTGMTLAYDGAGMLDSTYHEVHTLTKQVDPLRKMVKDGTISKKQLSHLIVFVAISNNDYARTSMIGLSSSNDINAYTGKVTKDIAANVQQLFKLGVNKVLVNKLHPINCKLSQTRNNNYTSCDISWKLGCIHPKQ